MPAIAGTLPESSPCAARALPLPSGVEVSEGNGMLAVRVADPAQLAAAEETIRRATYKDTDPKIARFNRRISLPISIALIPTLLTANQLSIILVGIGFYSAWLFSLRPLLDGRRRRVPVAGRERARRLRR
jgi:hypothetical protein